MIELGLEGKLIVDKAQWTDRMPQWACRPEPCFADPLARQRDAEAADETRLASCFARRYEKQDGSLAPNTDRAARAPIRVFCGRIPGGGTPEACRPEHVMARIVRTSQANEDLLALWDGIEVIRVQHGCASHRSYFSRASEAKHG